MHDSSMHDSRGVAGPAKTPNVIVTAANTDGGFKPCADEHENCKCSGTVQYRAWVPGVGHAAESLVPPGATSMMCENGQFGGDPAPGKAKRCLCRPQSSLNADTVKVRSNPAPVVNQDNDVGKDGGRTDDWHWCSDEYETPQMMTRRYCSCPPALFPSLLPQSVKNLHHASPLSTIATFRGSKSHPPRLFLAFILGVSMLVNSFRHDLCMCTGSVRYGPVTESASATRGKLNSADSIMCENAQFGGDPAPGIQKHCECKHDLSLGEVARSARFVVEKGGTVGPVSMSRCPGISPFVYPVEGRSL